MSRMVDIVLRHFILGRTLPKVIERSASRVGGGIVFTYLRRKGSDHGFHCGFIYNARNHFRFVHANTNPIAAAQDRLL